MPEFRKATEEDLHVLNKISIASKRHWGYPEEWIDKWLGDLSLEPQNFDGQIIIVAEHDAQSIGFCSITEECDHYEIFHLWLLPDFIGKGFGKQLLSYTIAEAVKEKKPILVEADPNAEAFYKSQGFVTFDQVESYPAGRYLPKMKRESA